MTQPTFASLAWDGKGKVTRRERFLAEARAVAKVETRHVKTLVAHVPRLTTLAPSRSRRTDASSPPA